MLTKDPAAEDAVRKGEEIYRRTIRDVVEADPTNYGQRLVLDIATGAYEIAPDVWQAADKLKIRFPNAQTYSVRIGFPASFSIGGGTYRG